MLPDFSYHEYIPQLLNVDNLEVAINPEVADLVYGDCIYESMDFRWVDKYWETLKPNGIFIVQTDWHTVFEYGVYLKQMPNAVFVNHIVWKNEWGNHPHRRMHQSFDDILIFAKGEGYKFYPERIQVPKATAKTKLNPSGRMTKTATAWIEDVCLTTTSPERVKKSDGHLVRWQKPLKLYDRIILPITDEGDLLIDTHMGSGSLAEWSVVNQRNYVGLELDAEVYELARARIARLVGA